MGAPIAAARAIEIEAAAATELTGHDGERASEEVERRDKKNKRQKQHNDHNSKARGFPVTQRTSPHPNPNPIQSNHFLTLFGLKVEAKE